MRYVIDIDGVVCNNTWGDYQDAKPIQKNIDKINLLFEQGHEIIMLTARGYVTGIDHRELTERQFEQWGLKYHELHFGKPNGDVYVDDKALNIAELSGDVITITEKPWGYEELCALTEFYMIKRLYIKDGYCSSLHYHKNKTETFEVLMGTLIIELSETERIILECGDTYTLEPNTYHRLYSKNGDLLIKETSTPHLDDSWRIEMGGKC